MRILKLLAWIVGGLVITALGLEIGARTALDYKPLLYSVPYDPHFVFGEFVGGKSRAELSSVLNSPAANGYQVTPFGQYLWNGEVPVHSLTAQSDFLFANYLSRYSSREVDKIVCQQPQALGIFVLGGSVAVGSSATTIHSSWHALLEGGLRKNLRRDDVYVFNAAMGAYRSIQERLAYHLAVFPRAGEFVLLVNGANDLLGPASSGERPGDSSQLTIRYSQFYGDPLVYWLAERSALFNTLYQDQLVRTIIRHRERLTTQDEFFDRYAESAVRLYLENMSAILRDCEIKGTTCLVGVQPVRSLSASLLGAPEQGEDVLPPERVRQVFDLLWKKLAQSRYAANFIDLTGIIKSEDDLKLYTDRIHLDDRGQELLAAALLPPVEAAARAMKKPGQRTGARAPVIPCEPAPALP